MTVKQIAAIAAAVTTIAGAAAAVGYRLDRPVFESRLVAELAKRDAADKARDAAIASNQSAIALQTYQRLKAVQASRPLTPQEQIILCRAAPRRSSAFARWGVGEGSGEGRCGSSAARRCRQRSVA